ncbi:MAG: glycosyltransferase family 9 protein, partial [Candidatus Omnitrophica bacterium]|nr:glycosyltransferase family 9 protein [Candidatus Omnitrophota bacterium]
FFLGKNLKVVLIGDKNSSILNSEIARFAGNNVIDLSGKTDFFTLALLIKNSITLVTTDSGPMHIGAATGVETIAIFGPTDPEIHCPPGVKFLKENTSCSPCYKKNCKYMLCMKNISPEKVKEMFKIEKEKN